MDAIILSLSLSLSRPSIIVRVISFHFSFPKEELFPLECRCVHSPWLTIIDHRHDEIFASVFSLLFVKELAECSRKDKENDRRAKVLIETEKHSKDRLFVLVELGDRMETDRRRREETTIEDGETINQSNRSENEMQRVGRTFPTAKSNRTDPSKQSDVRLPVREDRGEKIVHHQMTGSGQRGVVTSMLFDSDVRQGDEFIPTDQTIVQFHLGCSDRLHTLTTPTMDGKEMTRSQTETSTVTRRERVKWN